MTSLAVSRRTEVVVGVLLAAIAVGVAVWAVLQYIPPGVWPGDFDVYRAGGQIALEHGSLYGAPVTSSGLYFTYPPIAAVLFIPLAALPPHLGALFFTGVTLALLWLVLYLAFIRLNQTSRLFLHPIVLATGVLPLAIFTEPVGTTLGYGQINVVLMALVIFDCLGFTPRWARGSLVGLAAAVKLTPALFVVFFLLRRDFRSAITAGFSFLLFNLIGLLIGPKDGLFYWFHGLFDVKRVGNYGYLPNQSLRGLLARIFFLPPGVQNALWILGGLAVLTFTVLAMRRALAEHAVVIALSLNALACLLISPISWSHHWVWLIVLIVGFVVSGLHRKSWPLLVLGCVWTIFVVSAYFLTNYITGVFTVAPYTYNSKNEILHLLGGPAVNAYIVFGFLTLILAIWWRRMWTVKTIPNTETDSSNSDVVGVNSTMSTALL